MELGAGNRAQEPARESLQDIDWTQFHFSSGIYGDEEDERDPFWQIACNYQEMKAQAAAKGLQIAVIRQTAVRAILRRTLKILRHFRRKTRLARLPWDEARGGEIALMETVDAMTGQIQPTPDTLIMELRQEKPMDLVLMIDTSLSMTGRKLAICAVAAAALAFRLRAAGYSILAFGSTAQVLKPLGSRMSPRQTAEKILEAPLLGYTNISLALARGAEELRKGRAPMKTAILLTDGNYTEGEDPEAAAGKFRRLEILMTADYNPDRLMTPNQKMNYDCCTRMARAGHGHVTDVRRYRHLPEKLLSLIRAMQQ